MLEKGLSIFSLFTRKMRANLSHFSMRNQYKFIQNSLPSSKKKQHVNGLNVNKNISLNKPLSPINWPRFAKIKETHQLIFDILSNETGLLNGALKTACLSHSDYEKLFSPSMMNKTLMVSEYKHQFFKPTTIAPFVPELSVLNDIAIFAKSLPFQVDFKDIIFVCGQHLLNTTVSLIKFLMSQGVRPDHIFMVGKNYSNNVEVMTTIKALGVNLQSTSDQLTLGGFNLAYSNDISAMWENCYQTIQAKKSHGQTIKGLIILDDGGHVSSGMPSKISRFQNKNVEPFSFGIVCIEQTSSGVLFTEMLPIPVIEVATTALKNWVEPPLVAAKCVEEIQNRLSRTHLKYPDITIPRQPTVGIVGLGKIGYAVLEQLIKTGYQSFIIFDKNEEKRFIAERKLKNPQITIVGVNELLALLSNSDIIIGCTGYDITANAIDIFKTIQSPKILASCSSKDTEFLSLLQHIQRHHRDHTVSPLEDIHYKNGFKAPIVLLRGGTPIGFTNGLESVFARGIEPIRGLKAMACLQAYYMLITGHKTAKNYMLNPHWQAFVADKWLASKPPIQYSDMLQYQLVNVEEIKTHSGGLPYEIAQTPLNDEVQPRLKLG